MNTMGETMKCLLIAIISVMLSSCSLVDFNPCPESLKSLNFGKPLIPLKIGNWWHYDVKNANGDSIQETFSFPKSTWKLEVGNIVKLNYHSADRRNTIEANRMIVNNEGSLIFYLPCGNNIINVHVNSPMENVIVGGEAYINNTAIDFVDPLSDEHKNDKVYGTVLIYKGIKKVKVQVGEFDAIVAERWSWRPQRKDHNGTLIPGEYKSMDSRFYFVEGLGMVKFEAFDSNSQLERNFELKEYQLN